MPSFDGDTFHNPQAEPGQLIKKAPNEITANVISKVKAAVASAFRMPAPAMALA
jgi:hypothetical protein